MNQKRQQLQHNTLGDMIAEKMAAAEPYAAQIFVGTLVGLVILGGIIWYASLPDTLSARAWDSYMAALGDRESEVAMAKLAENEEFKSTTASIWAKLSVGEIALRRGSEMLFRDRKDAGDNLRTAEEAFRDVESRASDAEIKARAQLGLAKVLEVTNKPEEAKKYFEIVAESKKGTTLGDLAAAGVKRMSNPSNVAVLAWFAEQSPRLPSPMPGSSGMGPGPSLPSDLPERPDIGLPTDFGSPSPVGPELPSLPSLGDTPATDSPAAPAPEAPASEAPAAEAPAPEAPAAGEKPIEPAPAAEEKPAAEPAAEEKPAESPASEAPAESK